MRFAYAYVIYYALHELLLFAHVTADRAKHIIMSNTGDLAMVRCELSLKAS